MLSNSPRKWGDDYAHEFQAGSTFLFFFFFFFFFFSVKKINFFIFFIFYNIVEQGCNDEDVQRHDYP